MTDVISDMSIAFAVIVSCPLSVKYFRKRGMLKKEFDNIGDISRVINPEKSIIVERLVYKNCKPITRQIKYSKIIDCNTISNIDELQKSRGINYGTLELIIEKPKTGFSLFRSKEESIIIPFAENAADVGKLIHMVYR